MNLKKVLKNKGVLLKLSLTLFILLSIPLTMFAIKKYRDYQIKAQLEGIPSLSLTTDVSNISVGDVFDVRIEANSGTENIMGIDVDLEYNSEILEMVEISKPEALDEIMFAFYEGLTRPSSGGIVGFQFSAYSLPGSIPNLPYSGSGTFATIRFEALSAGSTEIEFGFLGFDPIGTTDSNMLKYVVPGISSGRGITESEDILEEVNNLNLDILDTPANRIGVNLRVKFDSVPANNNDMNLPELNRQKRVRLLFEYWDVLTHDAVLLERYRDFSYNPDTQTHDASLSALPLSTGPYNILIKGPSHRQIRFCNSNQSLDYICQRGEFIDLSQGQSYTFDFSTDPLDAGDVDWQNGVGVQDWSIVLYCRRLNATQNTEGIYMCDNNAECENCGPADLNFDSVTSAVDVDLLYKTLSQRPDDE